LPSFDAEKVKGFAYNTDKARLLLEEAGFPNGKNLPEISLNTSNDYADICTFLANEWSKIGIKVNIDILEAATLREMMTKGQATFFRASWIADYPDAESFLGVFYGKNPAPPNIRASKMLLLMSCTKMRSSKMTIKNAIQFIIKWTIFC
jgi:oligopeptide transport system substrate-binding protein